MSDPKAETERLLLLDLQPGDVLQGVTICTNEVEVNGTFSEWHPNTGMAGVYNSNGLFFYSAYELLKFYVGRARGQDRSGAYLSA